jgi:hypothetical protein
MPDYSKMKCYDMKLFLFEWVALNTEEGKYIKYIGNMNRAQLIKVCSYTENKLTKDELIELILYMKEYLKEYRRKMKNRKEGRDSDDDESDGSEADESDSSDSSDSEDESDSSDSDDESDSSDSSDSEASEADDE